MYPNKFENIYYVKKENLKNSKSTDEQVEMNNKINSQVNFNNECDDNNRSEEDNSFEKDSPFDPLFKFYRFTGLSFLGRKSLDDSRQTKTWLLTLEISSILMIILLTMYWIFKLSLDPDYESIHQSTIGRIVLPAFWLNILIVSCLCRFIVNYKFDQIYNIELLLFHLIDDKKSVFSKLKKVVVNIIIISLFFISLSFIDGFFNLISTLKSDSNSNYNSIALAIIFILYFYHVFTGKFISLLINLIFNLIFNLITVAVSIMAFTSLKWYILKMFKHVINQINDEIELDTLSVGRIHLLRKRLYLIKEKSTLIFTNYIYFVVVILDTFGLIIAFYSVVTFGFKTRMSLMLLYSLIMLSFKLSSAWFIAEIPNQVMRKIH